MTKTVEKTEKGWLRGLNAAQREAVTSLDGPLLVLSGAGTGKTRVLTSRLAELLANGRAKPWNVLAVTFTNKAAREMKSRVVELVGPAAEQIWLGTFHSIGARMLRLHANLVGLKPDFTIIDTGDQARIIKQLIENENIDPKRWPVPLLVGVISRWKDQGLCPKNLTSIDCGDIADGRIHRLYKNYQDRLINLNAADFGDLLLHVINILVSHPGVLSEFQARLTHIMVDEYQDTNVAQYLWLRKLTGHQNNLCCVGDDDQSIYGWRGAEVGNILRFENDFDEAKIVRLEENYRSSGNILGAASAIIANNEARLGKTLFTSGDDGEKVRLNCFLDGPDEARNIANRIEAMMTDGAVLSEIAVLVRAGFQTREFEDRFISIGLPYRVVGTRFYERTEIRDSVAYLRLVAQPIDDLAFERVINNPKRGLGLATMRIIYMHARASNKSLFSAAKDIESSDEIRPSAKKSLSQFLKDVTYWGEMAGSIHHSDLAQLVLKESGYFDMLQNNKSPDAETRIENLAEFVEAMSDFESLQDFLEHIALVTDRESQSEHGEVSLMTLHASKGLEFDVVFLPGWEEGIFPSQRTVDENGAAGLEEERRLAYVGMTRARRSLNISFAHSRKIHGQWQSSIPSRFINEMPKEYIVEDYENDGNLGSRFHTSEFDLVSWEARAGYGAGWRRAAKKRLLSPGYDRETPKDETLFVAGDRVFHQKFGMGDVLSVEGEKLLISFDKAGRKRVVSGFVSKG